MAGLSTVPVGPESPDGATTVIPAATAMSLNTETAARVELSGIAFRPTDSLITSTWAVVTA